MAFVYPQDQYMIWKALKLSDRGLLDQSEHSCLYQLMQQIDQDDLTYGSSTAESIICKIQELQEIDKELANSQTGTFIKREKVEYVSEIEYQSNKSSSATYSVLLRAKKQEIISLLDPCGCCLSPRTQARVFS